jgi:hypothetical protein
MKKTREIIHASNNRLFTCHSRVGMKHINDRKKNDEENNIYILFEINFC